MTNAILFCNLFHPMGMIPATNEAGVCWCVVKFVLSGIEFSRFDADIHNTYTRNKIRIRDRLREEEEEKELSKELERIEKVHERGFETKVGFFKADSDASQTAKI